MGYHTWFTGEFELDEPLNEEQAEYLTMFAWTRRMKRNVEAYEADDSEYLQCLVERFSGEVLPHRRMYETVGLPIGPEGAYVADGAGRSFIGDERTELLHLAPPVKKRMTNSLGVVTEYEVDCYNEPPEGQPGLWCQWVPNDKGTAIEWDGGEKFYGYEEWLKYIIEHFLEPWGRKISGEVHFKGEEPEDRGIIYVKDNKVELVFDEITNAGPSWKTEHVSYGRRQLPSVWEENLERRIRTNFCRS